MQGLARTRDLTSATRLNGSALVTLGSLWVNLGFHRKGHQRIDCFHALISFLSDKTLSAALGDPRHPTRAGLIFDVPARGFQARCHWTGVGAERHAGSRLGSAVRTLHAADHEAVTGLAACSAPAACPAGIVQVVLKEGHGFTPGVARRDVVVVRARVVVEGVVGTFIDVESERLL